MNFLIDTQILIWSFVYPQRIRMDIKELMENSDNQLFVSSITFYEIQQKKKLGKLNFDIELVDLINLDVFKILEVNAYHCIHTTNLPFIHRDPFDRIQISQSILEKMPLITSDRQIHQYDFHFIKA